jgi:hypothetical protein
MARVGTDQLSGCLVPVRRSAWGSVPGWQFAEADPGAEVLLTVDGHVAHFPDAVRLAWVPSLHAGLRGDSARGVWKARREALARAGEAFEPRSARGGGSGQPHYPPRGPREVH